MLVMQGLYWLERILTVDWTDLNDKAAQCKIFIYKNTSFISLKHKAGLSIVTNRDTTDSPCFSPLWTPKQEVTN